MNSIIPPGAKPANAFAVITQKLTQINVFPFATGESDGELFARCGAVCMTTAANIVAQISANKGLRPAARNKAGSEALAFARMADVCMARAAELGLAAPATRKEDVAG
jgi:hypothetical protein